MKDRNDSNCLKGNLEVSPRTANSAKNVEKLQWKTTYDLEHSGIGPLNPMKLDNYEDIKTRRIFGNNDTELVRNLLLIDGSIR